MSSKRNPKTYTITVVDEESAAPRDDDALGSITNRVGDKIEFAGIPEDPSDGVWSLSLPESIYSTVFMLPVTVSLKTLRDKDSFLSIIITQIVLYIMIILIQAWFMIFTYKLIDEKHNASYDETDVQKKLIESILCSHEELSNNDMLQSLCSTFNDTINGTDTDEGQIQQSICSYGESDDILRILCLAANVCFIFSDILETVNMYRWLRCVPMYKRKVHKQILDFCRTKSSDSSNFPMQRYRNSSGLEVKKPAVGFTFLYRMMILLFVILPKFILGLWLLIYGTGFVASASSNSDLILNSVALLFIIQLDDISYDLLTPDAYKSWLRNSFEITFFKEEENKTMRWLPFFCFWGISGCVAGLYYSWCLIPESPFHFWEYPGDMLNFTKISQQW